MTNAQRQPQTSNAAAEPTTPKPEPGPDNWARAERDDWFYDELMTPQPDAAQVYFRNRLKALSQGAPAAEPSQSPQAAAANDSPPGAD